NLGKSLNWSNTVTSLLLLLIFALIDRVLYFQFGLTSITSFMRIINSIIAFSISLIVTYDRFHFLCACVCVRARVRVRQKNKNSIHFLISTVREFEDMIKNCVRIKAERGLSYLLLFWYFASRYKVYILVKSMYILFKVMPKIAGQRKIFIFPILQLQQLLMTYLQHRFVSDFC
ncbi:hypothetical protein L9F63_019135, partial [Diploptera punctata]